MIKKGDTFTIGNVFDTMRNPNRKWWQFWKPKFVQSDKLKVFKVL